MEKKIINDIKKENKNTDNLKKKEFIKKQKKILYKKLTKFNSNINKINRLDKKKNNTKNYNYDNIITDLQSVLNSPIVSLNDINKLISKIYKSNFFRTLARIYRYEHMEELKLQNKEVIDNIIDNDELLENIIFEYDVQCDDYAKNKITKNIIDILKMIYNKFLKLSDIIIYHTVHYVNGFFTQNFSDIISYLNEINFKTKNNKLINLIYNISIYDLFTLLYEYDIEKMLSSRYINETYYNKLTDFINKYEINKDIKIINNILIEILILPDIFVEDGCNKKYTNIINWIIENNKTINNLEDMHKIKLYGYINFLIFTELYWPQDFENITEFINNLETNIKIKYNLIVKQLQDNKIFNEKDIYRLKDIIYVENIIEHQYYNFITIRNYYIQEYKKQYNHDIKNINNKLWNYDDEKIYRFKYYSGNGADIKKITKIFLLNFIEHIKNKIEKEKDITTLYDLHILKYENNIYTFDEKINFFKKIYSGKITTKDIETFIIYHNQIANFLIQKVTPTENMLKLALNCGNINFIEKLIEMKYPITTKHITYLQNCNVKQLYELIRYFNKYNTLNYFENFDWYYHLNYNFPDINIAELIFNEDNKDLRNELNIKIKELNDNNNFNKLNNMDYIEFINYYRNSCDKIKFTIHDIIKFTDYNKRQFILNNM